MSGQFSLLYSSPVLPIGWYCRRLAFKTVYLPLVKLGPETEENRVLGSWKGRKHLYHRIPLTQHTPDSLVFFAFPQTCLIHSHLPGTLHLPSSLPFLEASFLLRISFTAHMTSSSYPVFYSIFVLLHCFSFFPNSSFYLISTVFASIACFLVSFQL